jgi:hypothetical protein
MRLSLNAAGLSAVDVLVPLPTAPRPPSER